MAYEKISVLWNPKAGPAEARTDLREQLAREFDHDINVMQTPGTDDLDRIVREAAEGADLLIAAGGDGTLNAVINSLMKVPERPMLGMLPFGTANNLCRALKIPLDRDEAIHQLASGTVRKIDLGKVTSSAGTTYFGNVASGGNSDRIIKELDDEDKQRWGAWCYLMNSASIMMDLTEYQVRITLDDQELSVQSIWNVMIANSEYAGSGMRVAPMADLEDGLLDVIIINDGTPLDLAVVTTEFLIGDYIHNERVEHHRVKRIKIEASPSFHLLMDGEILDGHPYEITAEPSALEVLVGEEYKQAPPDEA